MRKWFEKVFEDKYVVTLYRGDDKGKKVFFLRELKKIDNNTVVGRDMNRRKIEFKTVEPFDYHVLKEY